MVEQPSDAEKGMSAEAAQVVIAQQIRDRLAGISGRLGTTNRMLENVATALSELRDELKQARLERE